MRCHRTTRVSRSQLRSILAQAKNDCQRSGGREPAARGTGAAACAKICTMDRTNLDIDLLNRVNDLWRPIYPHLASAIAEDYGREEGTALELGPFSGGISFELARSCPRLDITIADESSAVLDRLRDWLAVSGMAGRIKLGQSPLHHLSFPDSHFDLVILRGLIFFVESWQPLLPEIFRVLKPGGLAVIGGGYGRQTPAPVIDRIAEESRCLNEKLGRNRLTVGGLEKELHDARLAGCAKTVTGGGLWVHLRKPGSTRQ